MTSPTAQLSQDCSACGEDMNPGDAWWWTSFGATCTEGCARDLLAQHGEDHAQVSQ